MKLMKYKILIFDLDDTLIDNKENVRSAFRTMLDAQGLGYTDSEFERWYGIDRKFWIDWLDGKIAVPKELQHETGKKSDAFLDWVRSQRVLIYFRNLVTNKRAVYLNNIYMDALNNEVIAIAGARDVLEYLSKKYKIVVVTNGPQVATQQKLDKIECKRFVTEILSADMFGYMKPKAEFFEAIEKRYSDFNRSDYLIIGDSLKSDVGFGVNTGIDSCWFNKNREPTNGLYSPTYTIETLSELIKLL